MAGIVPVPGLLIIAGTPGSGKTHATKYFILDLFKKKAIDYVIVFTMTESDYNYLPEGAVCIGFDERILHKILVKQHESGALRCLIVFDDMIGAMDFGTKIMNAMNTRYRHFNLSIIYITQHINRLATTLRECAFGALLFRLYTKRSISAGFESFGQRFFKNEAEFKNYMNANTNNKAFIWVNNRAGSNSFGDVYKVMRAPAIIPDVKIQF